jgi:hypothetical protein
LNYDDEDDHRQLVAVIGTGLLSSIFDQHDIRQPLKINDGAFNALVVDLRERGLCVIPDSTWVQ